MTDTLLTILGLVVYIPFIVQLAHTKWDKSRWTHQLMQLMLLLQWSSIMHGPAVMYICIGLLMVAFILHVIIARPPFRWTPFFIVAISYVAWFAVSLLWSAAPQKGLQFLVDNGLPLIGFALMASVLRISKDEMINLMRNCCYVALIFFGVAFITWNVSCAELHILPWHWPLFEKSFFNDVHGYKWIFRFLGGINGYTHHAYNLLPMCAVISIAIWLRKEDAVKAWFWWLLWIGLTFTTLLCQSRMILLFCAVIVAAYLIALLPTLCTRIIGSALILCLVTIIAISNKSMLQTFTDDPIRVTLYEHTWRYIHAKPLLGSGAGALNPVEICHTNGELYWPYIGYIPPEMAVADWPFKAHMLPHNQWLADWAHGGIVAFIISIALYLCLAEQCIRKKRYGETVFLLIIIVFSFFEPMLYIGKGLYLFGILSTCLNALEPVTCQTNRADSVVSDRPTHA